MAKKFLDIDEAAKLLGVSAAQLNDMRSRNEIRGFRDGATWKFRPEEVDKVAGDLKAKGPAPEDEGSIGVGSHPSDEDEGGSVLLSERELGSGPTTSSTIIGKSAKSQGPDSDIKLADEHGETQGAKSGSDVKLSSGSDVLKTTAGEPGSDIGLKFDELDSLELDFNDSGKSGSGTGSKAAGESKTGAGSKAAASAEAMAGADSKAGPAAKGPEPSATETDSGLSLADEELAVAGEGSRKAGGSDVGGSAIDLSGDDDLVLGGSGSDVTTKPGDSGISLMDPSDSGLSLDEPMELGGSTIEGGSLVLGEDDMITLGGEANTSAATQLRPDDDFLLTPTAAAGDESESGSQVIALDSIEGFDEDATQVAGSPAAMRMLEADISDADTMVHGAGMLPLGGVAAMQGMQPATANLMAPALPEAPYSIWNVLSLFVCVALLCLIGMIMYDMMRNISSWNKAYPINSNLMDALIDMFSGKK